MSNKLVVTDSHLGVHSDSDIWLKVVIDLFIYISKFCKKNKIKTIYHLGDFFHNRRSINTKTQDYAHEIANILSDLSVFIVVGNHDCYYKNVIKPTSLRIFEKYDHIKIIDSPTEINNVILVPWLSSIPETKVKYCLGHFEINGFHMNDNYVCRGGLNKKVFNQFDLVLSGHFHTPSKKDNIMYLGAPYAQTFHDTGGERGFYIFDDDNGNLDFHPYEHAPKYIKMNTNNMNTSLIEGNVVKLIFDEDYGTNKNQKIVDEFLSHKPLSHSIEFKVSDEEEKYSDDISMENKEQIAEEFIKQTDFPENINKKMLFQMFTKIMKETNENNS